MTIFQYSKNKCVICCCFHLVISLISYFVFVATCKILFSCKALKMRDNFFIRFLFSKVNSIHFIAWLSQNYRQPISHLSSELLSN